MVLVATWSVEGGCGRLAAFSKGRDVERVLISVTEASKALSLGRTTIYELINDGRLETIKLGRRRLVKVASVHRLIDAGIPPATVVGGTCQLKSRPRNLLCCTALACVGSISSHSPARDRTTPHLRRSRSRIHFVARKHR
ncbi:MAG: helix-turn-helix domain-containing protein [Alphaproteobacteria bacterium]|nr:MAG: helix-turn-helix domain-containing protein [Alphaproteobacteria bacterium]